MQTMTAFGINYKSFKIAAILILTLRKRIFKGQARRPAPTAIKITENLHILPDLCRGDSPWSPIK
jgi:hypothetical protein